MMEAEAVWFLERWHKRHPREDLIAKDGDGRKVPTDLGAAAVDMLRHYPLKLIQQAQGEIELTHTGYTKLAHVISLARKKGSTDAFKPEPIVVLDPGFCHGTVVENTKYGWYGRVDTERDPKSIWWVVDHPLNDTKFAFPCQCFDEKEVGHVAAVRPDKAAEIRAEWARMSKAGLLSRAGLGDLIGVA